MAKRKEKKVSHVRPESVEVYQDGPRSYTIAVPHECGDDYLVTSGPASLGDTIKDILENGVDIPGCTCRDEDE